MSKSHCNNGHSEILHWDDECPLCKLIRDTEEARAKLEEKITQLTGTLEENGYQIDQLRAQLGL